MRQQWKQKSTQMRQCETCGETLLRRRDQNGRLEGYRDFMRRRFCSLSCANSRSKGGDSRNAFLYHARKHLKTYCECCGQNTDLHAHHIDTNWRNNTPENIQTLCVFCHQFWHAMHIRHGATPTKPMPNLASLLSTGLPTELAVCAAMVTPSTRNKRKSS